MRIPQKLTPTTLDIESQPVFSINQVNIHKQPAFTIYSVSQPQNVTAFFEKLSLFFHFFRRARL